MRVLGYWLGLWDIVYLGGDSAGSWLRIVRTNAFKERYCVITCSRHKLCDNGRVDGIFGKRWMHYSVRKRLASAVMESLQGCEA